MSHETQAAPRYRCDCGWIGTEAEMGADYYPAYDDDDEVWSNWICPGCGEWQSLNDYVTIEPVP